MISREYQLCPWWRASQQCAFETDDVFCFLAGARNHKLRSRMKCRTYMMMMMMINEAKNKYQRKNVHTTHSAIPYPIRMIDARYKFKLKAHTVNCIVYDVYHKLIRKCNYIFQFNSRHTIERNGVPHNSNKGILNLSSRTSLCHFAINRWQWTLHFTNNLIVTHTKFNGYIFVLVFVSD